MNPQSTSWTPTRLLLVAALIGACTQLGHLWRFANWVLGTPETAYAAKTKADTVDEKFERYLLQQEAYTKALNEYVQHQQQPQVPYPVHPPASQVPDGDKLVIREWDGQTCWECVRENAEDCWEQRAWRRCE